MIALLLAYSLAGAHHGASASRVKAPKSDKQESRIRPGRVLGQRTKNETVMWPGMRITATTPSGTIAITAEDDLIRCYRWEGATRCVEMLPRAERWYGSLGLYYPGPGDHWREHHGIARGVLEEGQRHFQTTRAAVHWLHSQWLPYVYRDDGLAVGWKKWLPRRQLNVEVWQIYVAGRKPRHLPGSQNQKIAVAFLKREGNDASLVEAVWKNNLARVRALLDRGANPNARNGADWPVLVLAARRGYAPIVQALLEKGADPNARMGARAEDGLTPLLAAAQNDHAEIVRLLLAMKADPNAVIQRGTLQGFTALMLASMSGNISVVRSLLDAGANLNAHSADGDTALKWAVTEGHKTVIELLLEKGAEVDARDSLGMTPLMQAVQSGHVEIVKLLIARGANVNARDDAARRMYFQALFIGDTKTKARLEKSGKLNTRHEDGVSVLQYAGENRQIVSLLKAAGAK